MIYDMAVVDSEGVGGLYCPPLGQYIHFLSRNIHALSILYTFTLP